MIKGTRKAAIVILLTILLCVTVIEDKPLPDAIKKKGENQDKKALLKNIAHPLFKSGDSSGDVGVERQNTEANAQQVTQEVNSSTVHFNAGKLIFKGDIQSAIPSELDIKRENETGFNNTNSDSTVGAAVMEQNGRGINLMIKNASALDGLKESTVFNTQMPNNTNISKDQNSTNRNSITSVLHIKSDKTHVSAHIFQQNESKKNTTYTSNVDFKIENAREENVSQSEMNVTSESKLKYGRSLKSNVRNHNKTVKFDKPTIFSTTINAVVKERTTNSTPKVTKQTPFKDTTTVATTASTTTEKKSLANYCEDFKR